jgi:hypothetical protein
MVAFSIEQEGGEIMPTIRLPSRDYDALSEGARQLGFKSLEAFIEHVWQTGEFEQWLAKR